jgi:hypothetical protein
VPTNEIIAVEKIDQIAHEIDQYQKEIEDLQEHLTPTTPPVVKEKRKQEVVEKL